MKIKQPSQPWSDQQTKTLIDLFNLGLSATAIAKELGFSNRDAILGKLYRIRRHVIWARFLTRPADMSKSHKTAKRKGMSSYICGVDPGLSGAICLMLPPGEITYVGKNEPTPAPIIFFDMPVHEITINGKKKRRLDLYALGKFFDEHSKNISRAIVEDVTASPQMGVTSSFSFGFSAGAIQGIIAANFISMQRVSPRTWKKAMGLTADKDACRRQASEMYPNSCHLWSRAKDDGRAESLLLAHYGLQKGQE